MTTTRRNDPCPCGSGRKYKHCHGGNDSAGGKDPWTCPRRLTQVAHSVTLA